MSELYDKFKRAILTKQIDLTTDTIKAVLIDLDDYAMIVSAATNASPIQITTGTHGLTTGNRVTITGVVGNTAANALWTVTVVDSTNFTLDGSTGNGAYTSGGHAVDLTNDEFLSDIAAGARVATATLSTVTVAAPGGTVDADDTTFTTVTGDQSEAVVLYHDTGVEATSTLIACLDASTVTGLPVTPGGGNLDITWHADGIFKL